MQGDRQQLVARIKRSSKYWGQTAPNQWFSVRVVADFFHIRGNDNNYRLRDVNLGVRLANGDILELSSGKMICSPSFRGVKPMGTETPALSPGLRRTASTLHGSNCECVHCQPTIFDDTDGQEHKR